MFDIALFIFLLLSPIILLPAIGNISALQFYQFGKIDSMNSMLQLQFFQFGTIGLFIVSLFQKRIREYKDFWLSLFLAACLVSIFLHPISVTMSINIFLGFFLYKLVVEYTKNIKLVLIAIAIVSAFNFIFAVLQSFDIRLIYSDTGRIDGLMKMSSHLGTYQAMSVPILYMFNPILAVIPLIGLVLTKTTTAIVGVFVGGMYLLQKKVGDPIWLILLSLGSMWKMFFMSLSALLVVFIVRNRTEILMDFATRIWIWKDTIFNLDFLGVGFQKFIKPVHGLSSNETFFNAVHPSEIFNSTYNIYLYVVYSLGILSIPIFIWVYRQFRFKNQDKVARCLFASCLILLIIGLGQSFMEFPRLAGTAIVIFGLLKIKQGG
ncbi:hypothetical protein LCGC14_1044140 [marine sediment metagenome]|uniref:Uncharacterized protein n=1 Tax=marine sediment metagenome TaxID=412755 RepID=A0A0F9QX15_9ZZZZ